MIELVDSTTDTAAAARIRKTVGRSIYVDAQALEHFRSTLPMFRDWLALLDGEPVSIGACGLLPTGEESTAAFALSSVLREARVQGVGTAIYRQVSEHARSLGTSELETFSFDDDPGGVAFAEHRGFVGSMPPHAFQIRANRLGLDALRAELLDEDDLPVLKGDWRISAQSVSERGLRATTDGMSGASDAVRTSAPRQRRTRSD